MGNEEMYCLSVIIQMLNPNNTLSFNRLMAHGIGLVESIVYAILIAKQSYYNANGMLHEGGWFYSTIADLQESTTLGEKAQHTAITHLIGHGLIECDRKGMPAKRFFRIVNNPARINEILENGQRICDSFKKKSTPQSGVAAPSPCPPAAYGGAMPQYGYAAPVTYGGVMPQSGYTAPMQNTPSANGGFMPATEEKNAPARDTASMPVLSEESVENLSVNSGKMPTNGVDSSSRPSAVTSSSPAQDKSKDNKNQRKFYGDRSINRSAREKNFEGEKSENAAPTVENPPKAESFAEVLQEIGIDWYDITPFEPENEEFFEEYSERERQTRRCVLPYTITRNREAVIAALKYVSAFSYNCGCGESENRDESAYYNTVIKRLADLMTHEKTVLPKLSVTYANVFDAVNYVISRYTLSEFIFDFWEHWEDVKKKRDITHMSAYMMTCLWNFLINYDLEHEKAEKRREREIWNSG